MPDPTGTYSDGITFGCQDVTLTDTEGTSVTWTAIEGSFNRDVRELDSNNGVGVWRGSAYMIGKGKGSITLEYPVLPAGTPTTEGASPTMIPLPAQLGKFDYTTRGGVVIHCILLNVGENQGSEVEPKLACTFAELKNYVAPGS